MKKSMSQCFRFLALQYAACSMQFATDGESEYASDLPVSNDWDPGLSTKMPLEPFERFTALNRSWISYISKDSSNPCAVVLVHSMVPVRAPKSYNWGGFDCLETLS